MEKRITVKLDPKSGNFYAIRAKHMDHYVINTTGGPGEWTAEVNDDAAHTIIIEATGKADSELGCFVKRTNNDKEVFKHEKTHTLDANGRFSETLLC